MANQITLDESSRRYTRLLRYLTDYIYTVKVENGKAVETYHGPGCVAVTGYTSNDFQEDPDLWHSMVHINDKEAVFIDHAEKALSGIESFPIEHRIIHRDEIYGGYAIVLYFQKMKKETFSIMTV